MPLKTDFIERHHSFRAVLFYWIVVCCCMLLLGTKAACMHSNK